MTTNTGISAKSAPPMVAVTVLMTTEQAVQLDELSAAIRRATGQSVRRSTLIRAFMEALLLYRDSLQNCRSESAVCEKITRTLERAVSNSG